MKHKNILIVVTGSIACYKACEVVRILRKEGANVQVMMTKSAQNFIGIATFSALTGKDVITDLFENNSSQGLRHINMAIELDAIVVIPATANIICKVAHGIADELVSTTLSVCEQPTLFVPAMNFRMWQNKATINAVDILRKSGRKVLSPDAGLLASLHEGEGRLPGVTVIMNSVRELFKKNLPLYGKNVLVTAGPTREAIDPIRYISNRSSGKMGYCIAEKARDLGANVTLISGPVSLLPIPEVSMHCIESAEDLHKLVDQNAKNADYIFMAAAVADYIPKKQSKLKIKRKTELLKMELIPSIDILQSIVNKTKATVTAFALETHDGERSALKKLKDKGSDFIVLNYANEAGAGFDSITNRVVIYHKSIKFELSKDRKDRIAEKIISYVLKYSNSKKLIKS